VALKEEETELDKEMDGDGVELLTDTSTEGEEVGDTKVTLLIVAEELLETEDESVAEIEGEAITSELLAEWEMDRVDEIEIDEEEVTDGVLVPLPGVT